MDAKRSGVFLSQLRREKNLTQEQLGEKLGVSNKTVSRWENGNYMPPVEMLQAMSELYGITINEILSAERLSGDDYQNKAEENIKIALKGGPLTVKEQLAYYKKKWAKDHFLATVLVLLGGVAACLFFWGNSPQLQFTVVMLMVALFIVRYNLMMAYAQSKVYDIPDDEIDTERVKRNGILLRRLRISAMIALCVSLLVTTDLAYNYFSSQLPEINDGITIRGWLAGWIFDDDHWTRLDFLNGFMNALSVSGLLGGANLVLACLEKPKQK